MDSRTKFLAVSGLAYLCCPGAIFGDNRPVKCDPNQDRVWVYDSLTSFNVEAKLVCNTSVEITGHVKGYVQIRTEQGIVGYVPEAALPELAPLEADVASLRTSVVGPNRSAVTLPVPKTKETPRSPQPTQQGTGTVVASEAPFNTPAQRTLAVPNGMPPNRPAVASPASALPSEISSSVISPAVPLPSTTPSERKIDTFVARSTTSKSLSPIAAPAPLSVASARPAAASESEDFPDAQVENESADPSCRIFFSAYGLTPSQVKWLAQNRKKTHSNVCPAPTLAQVEFVLIFAHDVDSYALALPSLVHTDKSGFSDFNPMSTVDTTVMSLADADKARREYVWVFQFARGAFDPAEFSPRRRYQFTKTEANTLGSKASVKTIQDAFAFVEQTGLRH